MMVLHRLGFDYGNDDDNDDGSGVGSPATYKNLIKESVQCVPTGKGKSRFVRGSAPLSLLIRQQAQTRLRIERKPVVMRGWE